MTHLFLTAMIALWHSIAIPIAIAIARAGLVSHVSARGSHVSAHGGPCVGYVMAWGAMCQPRESHVSAMCRPGGAMCQPGGAMCLRCVRPRGPCVGHVSAWGVMCQQCVGQGGPCVSLPCVSLPAGAMCQPAMCQPGGGGEDMCQLCVSHVSAWGSPCVSPGPPLFLRLLPTAEIPKYVHFAKPAYDVTKQ